MVDAPKGAVPAVPAQPAAAPKAAAAAAPAPAPAAKPQTVTLTAQPSTPLTVRVATEVSSATAQAGQRFQGNLDADLVAATDVSWPPGARGSTGGSSPPRRGRERAARHSSPWS